MSDHTFLLDLLSADRLEQFYPDRSRLGRNLSYMRGVRGFTQEGLANRAGVTAATIRAIETGKGQPQMRTLTKLAAVLDISVSLLLEGV